MADIFNVFNQAALTRVINIAAQTRIEQINPLPRVLSGQPTTTEDKIRLQRAQIKSFGYAKPKAFGATPPIYVPRMRYTETEIELIPIHEMSPVDERLLRKLESEDSEVRARAGVDIQTRQTALRMRNELGWDVLTMSAILNGTLQIGFVDDPDQGFTLDYGYDPTHFTSVSTPWATLASSTPIDDMKAVQVLLANQTGQYARHFWMNSNTQRNLIESAEAKALLTGFDGRAQFIPTLGDIATRMYDPDNVQFHVSDSGYRGETYERGLTAHTKFLPDNVVIVTTDDPFEGERLVEVWNGSTAVPQSEFAPPALLQGNQSWVKLDTDSLTTYYHEASTRIPMVNRPDCIAIMDVS